MFGLFKKNKKLTDDVFDKDNGLIAQAGAWIGNLKITDEEKMEANINLVKSIQDHAKDTLNESTERSKARRDIANLWIKSQLALVFMCAFAAPFDMELAKFYFMLATSALMLSTTVSITIFFFGSHGLAKFQDKFQSKKKKD